MRRRFLLVILALLGIAAPALGQQVDGALEMRILNAAGEPLPDVRVSATGPNLQGARTAVTDRDGWAHLPALPVGAYVITISHVAYQGMTFQDVAIELGKTSQLGEIRLQTAV